VLKQSSVKCQWLVQSQVLSPTASICTNDWKVQKHSKSAAGAHSGPAAAALHFYYCLTLWCAQAWVCSALQRPCRWFTTICDRCSPALKAFSGSSHYVTDPHPPTTPSMSEGPASVPELLEPRSDARPATDCQGLPTHREFATACGCPSTYHMPVCRVASPRNEQNTTQDVRVRCTTI
jgi:hypothetical protein